MDPKFQSSFIPKGPIATSGSLRPLERPSKGGFFGFLAVVIFIIAVLLSAAVFGYKLYLTSQINTMSSDLTVANKTLDPDSITELTRMNSRIISTTALLARHVVLSPLFSLLETTTPQSVRLTDFNYSVDSQKNPTLDLKGEASGYDDIAVESKALSASPDLSNVVFSNMALNAKGAVTFEVTADIAPALVSYQGEVNNSALPPAVATSTKPAIVASTTAAVASSTPKTAVTTASTTSSQ